MGVLVTGGTGALGGAVLRELLDAGHDLCHRDPVPESLSRAALADPRDQSPDPPHGEDAHHEEPDEPVDLDHGDESYAARVYADAAPSYRTEPGPSPASLFNRRDR